LNSDQQDCGTYNTRSRQRAREDGRDKRTDKMSLTPGDEDKANGGIAVQHPHEGEGGNLSGKIPVTGQGESARIALRRL